MFKSSFSKYITAFFLIILLSFIMLSGIITSIIRTHATEERQKELADSAKIITEFVEREHRESEDIEFLISLESQAIIKLVIDLKDGLDIILADNDGKVLLITSGGELQPIPPEEIMSVDLGIIYQDEEKNGFYHGDLNGFFESEMLAYSRPIANYAHVITFSMPDVNSGLVKVARSSVINSSVWVMLAAVIATYFITERIIHPLKMMTVAAKKFAKGDFSSRITVYGHDEVSELGKAFNNMAESLDSLEKMRNAFLANVSHDLRTPMTTISGFIEGITSGAIPPEKHDYYLGIISAEVHRLSRLVNQILDVSRLESGERKFNFTDFDIAEVSRIILISFEQKIYDKKLNVVFDAEEDEMFAFADKDAIYQVVYNLCHNAIKFAKEGGMLKISLSRAQGKKIIVSIYDDGQVVNPEETKLIFDRFYKTDQSRGLDKNGVGLGLYICKTIIDAHEEQIEAIPVENLGCEFRFSIKEGTPVQKRRKIDQ